MDSEELMQGALEQISSMELRKQSTCHRCKAKFEVVGEKNLYGYDVFPPTAFCEACENLVLEKMVPCQRCEVPMQVKGKLTIFGEVYPEVEYCSTCESIVAEEKHQFRIDAELKKIPELLAAYGIPPKLASINFALPEMLRPFMPLIRFLDTRGMRGLCLSGPSGVGKTFSMAMLIRDWLKEAIRREERYVGVWKFVNYPSFIMQVQDAYRKTKSEESPLAMLDTLAIAPFLVIDDLGVEKATEFVKQSTYYVLNEREMNMRPTYITTNFTMNQLNDAIDQRISSRIVGMCEIKEVKGSDRRIVKK